MLVGISYFCYDRLNTNITCVLIIVQLVNDYNYNLGNTIYNII